MSNNPFTNNRFSFLSEDEPINKTEKKSNIYEPEKNSFTKPLRRDNDRRDANKHKKNANNFKSADKPVEFTFDKEMFPDLISSNANESNVDNTSTNFKDTLNTAVIEEEFTGLKPGWIEIYKNSESKQNIINHGDLTPHEIRMNKLTLIEDDPNYIMNRAIHFVMYNREKYITEYDDMYGEGAYYDKYVMPPVYGPEYDTEEEEVETYSDSYDDTEYSDNYDEYL